MSRNRDENFAPSLNNEDDYDPEPERDGSNRRSRSTDDARGRPDRKRFDYNKVNYSKRLIASRERGLPKVGKYKPVDVSRFKKSPSGAALNPKATPRIGSGLRRANEKQQNPPKPLSANHPPTSTDIFPVFEPYLLNYMNNSGFIHSLKEKKKEPSRSRSPNPDSPPPQRSSPKSPTRSRPERNEPNRTMDDDEPDKNPGWGRTPQPSHQSPSQPQRFQPNPHHNPPFDDYHNQPEYPHNPNIPYHAPTFSSHVPEYQPDPRQFPPSPALPETPEFHGKQLPRTPPRLETPELHRNQLPPTPARPETPELPMNQIPRTPARPETPDLHQPFEVLERQNQPRLKSPDPMENPQLRQLFDYPPDTQEPHRQQWHGPTTTPEPEEPYRQQQPLSPTLQPNYPVLENPLIQPSRAVPVYSPAIYVPDTPKQSDREPLPRQTEKPKQVDPFQPTSQPKKGPPLQPAFQPGPATPSHPATQPNQATPREPPFQPKQTTPPQTYFEPLIPAQPSSRPKQSTPIGPSHRPKQTTPPQRVSQPKKITPYAPSFMRNQTTPPPKSVTPRQTTPPRRILRPDHEPSKYLPLPKYAPPPREVRQSQPSASLYSPFDRPLLAPPSRRTPRSTYEIPEVRVSRPYEPYYDLSRPLHAPYFPLDDYPPRFGRSPAAMPRDDFRYPEYPRKVGRLLDRPPEFRRDYPDQFPPLTTYYPPTLGVEKAGLYEMGTITRSMGMYRHPADPGTWSVRK